MRILVLNPNTSEGVTDRIAAVARAAARPGTELSFATASWGVPYISTRTEALIGAQAALEIVAAREGEVDAVVLAAFGDPGLGALREMFPFPVVGLAEASMLAACPLGRRFSIVSFATGLAPWYRDCVEWCGMQGRLASIRMLDAPFDDVNAVQADFEDLLVELACRAAREDGAEVVLTAGAPLAGLAGRVRGRIPVPVIEGVAAAVGMAELLCMQNPRAPQLGAFRRPGPKASNGLSAPLARLLAGEARSET